MRLVRTLAPILQTMWGVVFTALAPSHAGCVLTTNPSCFFLLFSLPAQFCVADLAKNPPGLFDAVSFSLRRSTHPCGVELNSAA